MLSWSGVGSFLALSCISVFSVLRCLLTPEPAFPCAVELQQVKERFDLAPAV